MTNLAMRRLASNGTSIPSTSSRLLGDVIVPNTLGIRMSPDFCSIVPRNHNAFAAFRTCQTFASMRLTHFEFFAALAIETHISVFLRLLGVEVSPDALGDLFDFCQQHRGF